RAGGPGWRGGGPGAQGGPEPRLVGAPGGGTGPDGRNPLRPARRADRARDERNPFLGGPAGQAGSGWRGRGQGGPERRPVGGPGGGTGPDGRNPLRPARRADRARDERNPFLGGPAGQAGSGWRGRGQGGHERRPVGRPGGGTGPDGRKLLRPARRADRAPGSGGTRPGAGPRTRSGPAGRGRGAGGQGGHGRSPVGGPGGGTGSPTSGTRSGLPGGGQGRARGGRRPVRGRPVDLTRPCRPAPCGPAGWAAGDLDSDRWAADGEALQILGLTREDFGGTLADVTAQVRPDDLFELRAGRRPLRTGRWGR